jgi:hypothetical protein
MVRRSSKAAGSPFLAAGRFKFRKDRPRRAAASATTRATPADKVSRRFRAADSRAFEFRRAWISDRSAYLPVEAGSAALAFLRVAEGNRRSVAARAAAANLRSVAVRAEVAADDLPSAAAAEAVAAGR